MTDLDFRALVEAAPDVVAVLDRDHRYLFANRAFAESSGHTLDWLLGKRNDEVVPPQAVAMWREAIDHVLHTGEERWLERTIDTPKGPRRYSARLIRLSGDLVCAVTRDVTELRAEKLLTTAAQTMPIGMCVVEAPSGRVAFRNEATLRIFGPLGQVESVADYALVSGWDVHGRPVPADGWPVARALRGEIIEGETYRIRNDGTYRMIRISASPVRDAQGAVSAAVAIYSDVTDEVRAHDAATFLAEVGAVLEDFDDTTGLQRIAELAVPRIADWAFIHTTAGDQVVTEAIGHAEPAALATARRHASTQRSVAADTAVARVLAGGAPELVIVDDAVLVAAALDAAHLERLRSTGYRSSVVAPLVARGRVLGAITLTITDSPRQFDDADLRMITELARRVGVALDNARLFRAEREARCRAEQATARTRGLQELTAQLSGALDEADVVSHVVIAGRGAVGAAAGFAWLLRDDDTLELAAHADASGAVRLSEYSRIPLAAALPACEVVRTTRPLVFETLDAMLAAFPGAITRDATPYHAWAVIPFAVNGRAIGAASFSFDEARAFSLEDRELLAAMTGQAALALERARLYDELRRKDERLRTALLAGRAGSWSVDLRTLTSQRDASFAALFDLPGDVAVDADFATVHPDDRETASAAFTRTLRDGVPYEPEIRLRKGDGSYIWTRSYGRLVSDARGPALLTGLTFDIDEAKRASLELERAYAAAREADRRKDEFLAMLGHELRNPLAPIRTALDLMEFKAAGVLQKERDVIGRQVDHLSRLIDDLLDVSRITRGKVQLARSVVELGGVLAKAIEMASPLLEKHAHRLTIDVPRTGLLVDADPTRLAQVFQNLITNAAKYTRAHGEIEVYASAGGDDIRVQIRDNGIGIAPELLPHLFELFTQGERALDRSEGGLGIGLAIARSLCELHGGSISADSPGPNQGSTFTVRLPRASGVAAPASPTLTAARRRTAKPSRVLVVDDNVDAAVTLHEFLTHLGHEAATAHDGVSALELAATFQPDIAVLDIGLPVMDGYELARRLRDQLGARIRLVAVTGYGQESDRARSREAGFDHHIVKPIAFEVLSSLLDGARGPD